MWTPVVCGSICDILILSLGDSRGGGSLRQTARKSTHLDVGECQDSVWGIRGFAEAAQSAQKILCAHSKLLNHETVIKRHDEAPQGKQGDCTTNHLDNVFV